MTLLDISKPFSSLPFTIKAHNRHFLLSLNTVRNVCDVQVFIVICKRLVNCGLSRKIWSNYQQSMALIYNFLYVRSISPQQKTNLTRFYSPVNINLTSRRTVTGINQLICWLMSRSAGNTQVSSQAAAPPAPAHVSQSP